MGTIWSKSGSMEFDNNGVVAPGALAYFYIGNTTTPLAVFEEAAESTPHTFPLEADGNGRWPDVFIPFIESYDVKVTTSGGTQLYYPQEIPNPNPVEAAADSVEDSDLFATGDMKFRPSTGTAAGFVRCNGRTLGDASSSATERANADTEDLFLYLWNNFSNSLLAVSGGRGGSAASDYAAHKTIALFDLRSGTLVGVDDMGNSAASRAGSITFATGNSTTGGSTLGSNTHTITEANLPDHAHVLTGIVTGTESADHTHSVSLTSGTESQSHTHTVNSDGAHAHTVSGGTIAGSASGGENTITGANPVPVGASAIVIDSGGAHTHTAGNASQTHTHSVSGTSGGKSGTHTHTLSGNTGAVNGLQNTAHNLVQYGISGTWYIKL